MKIARIDIYEKPLKLADKRNYHADLALYYKSIDKAVILMDVYNRCEYFIEEDQLFDGLAWARMSAQGFLDRHPYFSRRTVQRHLSSMEKGGMIFSRTDLNKERYDKTKWYTVNFQLYNYIILDSRLNGGPGKPNPDEWIKALETLIGQNDQGNF